MALTEKTVRVFISSTFRDMHAERDHLVTVVFPELRERLERLGLELYDVDLRWGVPEKGVDGEKANSWAYCKQWIERVEPFFISLLGQRYGWITPETEICDEEDRAVYQGLSITEMEIRYAVFSGKLRRRSFFYFRQTIVPQAAPPKIYHEFVDLNPSEQQRLQRLKDKIVTAGRPVRHYDCRWTGTGFADLDAFGRRMLEDLWSGVLRDERYVSTEAWQKALGHEPDHDALYTDESQPVSPELWEKIIEAAKPVWRDPLVAEHEQTAAFAAARLRRFRGRARELGQLVSFINNNDLPAEASRVYVVRAVAGRGKSALLAKLAEQLMDSSHLILTHFVGATERGADVRTLLERLDQELERGGILSPLKEDQPQQDLESLRKRFAARLENYAGPRRLVLLIDALNQMSDGYDLSWLPRKLGSAVRFILSSIDDPTAAPESPEACVLSALRARRPEPQWVDLQPLDEHDVRQIIQEYLVEYCKELDVDQIETLCRMEQAHNPLYLLVMLNELRTLGGNDMNKIVPQLIAEMRAKYPDTARLFDWVLERLEVFGAEAVKLWCIYLSLGRVGMSSRELSDLLARKLGEAGARTALLVERSLRRYLQKRGPQLDFFHGQLRQAVQRRYGPEDMVPYHAEIAEYLETRWHEPDVHALSELPYHQGQGRMAEELNKTLTNFAFMDMKVMAYGPYTLIDDYRMALSYEKSNLINPAAQITLSWKALCSAFVSEAYHIREELQCLTQQIHNALVKQSWEEQKLSEIIRAAADYKDSGGHNWFKLLPFGQQPKAMSAEVVILTEAVDVKCVALRPNHNQVAVGGTETLFSCQISLWDLGKPALINSFGPFPGTSIHLVWLPDNQHLLSAHSNGDIRIIDVNNQAETQFWRTGESELRGISLSLNGLLLACIASNADKESRLTIWDPKSGKNLGKIGIKGFDIETVLISQDNNFILLGGAAWDRELNITGSAIYRYDILQGTLNKLSVFPLSQKILRMAIDHKNRLLACGNIDGSIIILNVRSGIVYAAFSGNQSGQPLKGDDIAQSSIPTAHLAWVQCIAFSPDDKWLVSGSGRPRGYGAPGELCIWDVQKRTLLGYTVFPVGLEAIAFISNTQVIVGGQSHLSVGPLINRSYTNFEVVDYVTAIAFSANGQRKVFASKGKLIIIDDESANAPVIIVGHAGQINSLDWHPYKDLILSGGSDSRCYLWDVLTGLQVKEFIWPFASVLSARFSPDGSIIAMAGDKGRCLLLSLEGKIIHQFTFWDNTDLTTISFSQNGHLLAIGGTRGDCEIWDLKSFKKLTTLKGHKGKISDISFTSTGYIATASTDATCCLWEPYTGRQVQQYHTKYKIGLRSVTCHPRFPGLITIGNDGRCQVWLEDEAKEIAYLPRTSWVCGIATLPEFNILKTVDLLGVEARYALSNLFPYEAGPT